MPLPCLHSSSLLTLSLILLHHCPIFVHSARFDHFSLPPGDLVPNYNTPVVTAGPPNPPALVHPLMGLPDWRTCAYLRLSMLPANQDPLLGPGCTRLVNFRGPGSLAPPPPPNDPNIPNLNVPKTWTSTSSEVEFSGDCSVTMVTVELPGEGNYDRATFRDMHEAQVAIMDASRLGGLLNGAGGVAEFGESNGLAIFVYEKNSDFGRRLDKKNGCMKEGMDGDRGGGAVKGIRVCGPGGLDTIPEGAEGEEGEDDEYDTAAGTGEGSRQCSTESLGGGAQELMYGLKEAAGKANKWVLRSCRGFIWEISTKN